MDVSDVKSPKLAGSYDAGGGAHAVAVSGGYAYVADGAGPVILHVGDRYHYRHHHTYSRRHSRVTGNGKPREVRHVKAWASEVCSLVAGSAYNCMPDAVAGIEEQEYN